MFFSHLALAKAASCHYSPGKETHASQGRDVLNHDTLFAISAKGQIFTTKGLPLRSLIPCLLFWTVHERNPEYSALMFPQQSYYSRTRWIALSILIDRGKR